MQRLAHIVFPPALVLISATIGATQDPGYILTPKQSAPIRDAPPTGFWQTPGDQTGATTSDDQYVILENFNVQSGLGTAKTWVMVAPIDPATGEADSSKAGWVYWGDIDANSSPNFTAQRLDELSPELQRRILLPGIGD